MAEDANAEALVRQSIDAIKEATRRWGGGASRACSTSSILTS